MRDPNIFKPIPVKIEKKRTWIGDLQEWLFMKACKKRHREFTMSCRAIDKVLQEQNEER